MLAEEEVRHHAALVDAIAGGNAAAAERAAQALIEALRDALLSARNSNHRRCRRR
jgi:DNA-binding FadR family transcriptional regulator